MNLSAMFFLAAMAVAGVRADKPKYAVGHAVKAKPSLRSAHSCNTRQAIDEYIAEHGSFSGFKDCTYYRDIEWSGKRGRIRAIERRVCASDVGDQMAAFRRAHPDKALGSYTEMEEQLRKTDSCDEYAYSVEFPGLGRRKVFEGELN